MRVSGQFAVAAFLMALLAVIPLLASVFAEPFWLTLVSRIMIFALAVLGLNLALGYGALVSFGHAMYVGIGAYAVGILASHGISNGWAHLGVALGAGALVALLTGLVCLRASGLAFIMITLAFAQMFYFLAISLRAYGGDDGLPIAARSDFALFSLGDNVVLYYVILVALGFMMFVIARMVDSKFGMVLRGCKLNERRMLALGFPTLRYKLLAYIFSALTCVLAGVLLANLTRFASPSYMQWTLSGELIAMAVLGGIGTLVGPVIGAAAWLLLEEGLTSFHAPLPWGIDVYVREHWMLVLGAFIVVCALRLKQGLYGWLTDKWSGGA
jgi:branched-chain amino acid transport system permease protein